MRPIRSYASAFVVLALAGCGGGGGSSSPAPSALGRASVSVAWPARSARLVPTAANSVVVTLTQGKATSSQTLTRPDAGGTGTASFSELAYGAYAVTVVTYPSKDGSGVAQAKGSGSLTVAENAPGTASVALASTVARLSLGLQPFTFDKGTTVTASVSAFDAGGAIVPLAAGGGTEPLAWSIDNSTSVALTTDGITATLKGVRSGGATLSVSMVVDDAGTKVTTSAPVTVNAIADGAGTVTVR